MSGAKKKLDRRAARAEMGMSEREKQELQKQKAQRRNNIIAIVGGVIAVLLVAALLIWNAGFIPRHITAVKLASTDNVGGDLTLTQADLNYFYYAAMNSVVSQEQQIADVYAQNGLTYTPSFDASASAKGQYIDETNTMSYHDYFKQQALSNATELTAMANAAKAAGHTLSEDAQTSLDNAAAQLDAQVQQSGYGNRNTYLRLLYGRTTNDKVYFKNLERNIWAADYFNASVRSADTYTDEELTAYYADHVDELDSYSYSQAYFDGTVQTAAGDGEDASAAPSPTDEEKAAALAQAKQDAESLISSIKANAATPAEGEEAQVKDFTTLAADFGVQAQIQTGNAASNFVNMPYADWLKDSARADGDVEIFTVENAGYYVVQFQGRQRSDIPVSTDVRHILIKTSHDDDPETPDVDESTVPFTDEEKAAAYAEAQSILQEFTAGEQTGERFGELAEQHSDDTRDDEDNSLLTPGGLYEVTASSNFMQEFKDWALATDRKAGDTGIVETTYGYHIMFADSVEEATWKDNARTALQTDEQQAFLDEVLAKYPIAVNKWYNVPEAQESQEPQESPAN